MHYNLTKLYHNIISKPIEQVHLFNVLIRPQSKFASILLYLYDKPSTIHTLEKNNPSITHEQLLQYINRAIKKKLAIKKRKKIILTINGRWYCIAARHNISFSTLCILADMYIKRKQTEKHNIKFYAVNIRVLERFSFSHAYEKKIFSKEIQQFAYRTKHLLYMYDHTYESLHKYRHDLLTLLTSLTHAKNDQGDYTAK
jgi:hypothetical protein